MNKVRILFFFWGGGVTDFFGGGGGVSIDLHILDGSL